jgi:hypothetical protein
MASFSLFDVNGQRHSIDTTNLELFQKWFEEYLPAIQEGSQKYHYPWRMEIYASFPGEMMGTGIVSESFTYDQLAGRLRAMAAMIEKKIEH